MRKPVVTVFKAGDSTVQAHLLSREARSTTPPGPVFVLVHGIGMSHRYFRRLQQELSRMGDVYAIDLPGFGNNRRPRTGATVLESAAVLIAAIDALGIASCVLVGHSMGAQFAIETCILRPDVVSKLVLIAPVADPRRPVALRHALRMTINSAFETPAINTIEFLDYLRCGPSWYLDQVARMFAYPIEERLPMAARPVLIVRGAHDLLAQRGWCAALGELAADGRTVSIPGAAHVVQYRRPAQVSEVIRDFTEVAESADARP